MNNNNDNNDNQDQGAQESCIGTFHNFIRPADKAAPVIASFRVRGSVTDEPVTLSRGALQALLMQSVEHRAHVGQDLTVDQEGAVEAALTLLTQATPALQALLVQASKSRASVGQGRTGDQEDLADAALAQFLGQDDAAAEGDVHRKLHEAIQHAFFLLQGPTDSYDAEVYFAVQEQQAGLRHVAHIALTVIVPWEVDAAEAEFGNEIEADAAGPIVYGTLSTLDYGHRNNAQPALIGMLQPQEGGPIRVTVTLPTIVQLMQAELERYEQRGLTPTGDQAWDVEAVLAVCKVLDSLSGRAYDELYLGAIRSSMDALLSLAGPSSSHTGWFELGSACDDPQCREHMTVVHFRPLSLVELKDV